MRKEYAFEGFRNGTKIYWSDAWGTLKLVRKAAADWVGGDTSRKTEILKRIPLPPGHEIGARWEKVE